jgi:hypothetical protein
MEQNQSGIRSVQKASYAVPWTGDPRLHEEVMWYATSDDRVLGVVIRDRVDNDFIMQTSRPTIELATEELHGAMCKQVR